jgi:hypothetical protein
MRNVPLAVEAVAALLLVGGFLFGRLNAEQTRRMPAWTRLGCSGLLVLASVLWWSATGWGVAPALFIMTGMLLGFLGDVSLAKVLPLRHATLWGLGFFAAGHIAYLNAIYRWSHATTLPTVLVWAAWWLVSVGLWYLIVRGRPKTALHYAALPYALLLATTVGCAMGLALQDPKFIPLAVGAALFWLSDLLLAAQLLRGTHFRLISDVVWFLYAPGQMLIVLTAAG